MSLRERWAVAQAREQYSPETWRMAIAERMERHESASELVKHILILEEVYR